MSSSTPLPPLPPLPPTAVEDINRIRGGFNRLLGLEIVSIAYDEIVGELEIGEAPHQPYGVVHGGVYSAMVETLASLGAALWLQAHGRHTVGLDNHTSFLRAVRSGRLRGVARPLARGKRTQLWQVEISHAGELVATGRVRLLGLEHGAALAGEVVSLGEGQGRDG